MEKSKSLKFGLKKLICLIVTLLVTASFFGFLSPNVYIASVAEQYTEYPATSLSLNNGHFNTSSSSYPASASGWTGKGESFVIAGIIELTTKYSQYADKIGLNKYEEYANGSIPQTPFGKAKTENGNMTYFADSTSSALLINTANHETVYTYTSSALTLDANGFYKISAWVKTGDFSKTSDKSNVGAAISLSGIDESTAKYNGYDEGIAFTSINTAKNTTVSTPSDNYGWKEYDFFIATDYHSYTVTLNLSVGYSYESEDGKIFEPANGYALFDTAAASSISPEMFEAAQKNGKNNIIVIDCDKSAYLTDKNNNDIGSFANFDSDDNHNIKGWSQITSLNGEEFSPQTGESPFIFNPRKFITDNNIKLETNPATPFGISDKGNNILMFFNEKPETKGIQSVPFTIKRNNYLKVSFWTNTANLDSDNAVFASLVYATPNDPKNEVVNTISNIKGNPDNKKNYGWVYNAFFIKASFVRDYDLSLQLWFGRGDTPAKGIAMFDDIKIEEITASTYSDYSASFTSVDLTSDYSASSGITNGDFTSSSASENTDYPLTPSDWTETSEDKENIITGLLPKDDKSVWDNLDLQFPFSELMPHKQIGNALVISSKKPIYFGYTSSEISLATETTTLITVRLRTYDGAKANITAKSDDSPIAKIVNVGSDREFTDYKIYLKNNEADRVVTLEISLGQADNKSSGTIVVENVRSESLEEFDYESYKNNRSSTIAVYDYEDMFACDLSSYSSDPLMEAYHWSYAKGNHDKATNGGVKFGILDLRDPRSTYLSKDFNQGRAPKNYIFYAENTVPTASVFTYKKSIGLNANTYYKIQVTAKVEIPSEFLNNNPDAVGLGIKLDNTSYSFANIKQSRTDIEDSEFKTYSFYIKVGAENAPSANIALTLGGIENTNQFVKGKLFVNNIVIDEISEPEYNNSIETMVEFNEENSDKTDFGLKVDLSEGNEEQNTEEEPIVDESMNPENLYWYILPSVLFGIFLLLALVAVVIRKFGDKIGNRKHKEKANSYDRDYTLNMDVNDEKKNAEKKKTIDKYESFDEDVPVSELNNSESDAQNEITATIENDEDTKEALPEETQNVTENSETEVKENPEEKKESSTEDFND